MNKEMELIMAKKDYYFADKNLSEEEIQQGLIIGTHGPEIKNDSLYISIFHYLEYKIMNPHKYNTFNLGNYLTGKSNGDYLTCKYRSQNFTVNKFNLESLKQEEVNFNKFIK